MLNQEVMSLFKQGRYDRAVVVAKKALQVAEKAVGPNHPNVATSLNNFAALYQAQGQYAQAEPLYQRSLAIREKALGPDHPDVAASLENMAVLYRKTGRGKLQRRSKNEPQPSGQSSDEIKWLSRNTLQAIDFVRANLFAPGRINPPLHEEVFLSNAYRQGRLLR